MEKFILLFRGGENHASNAQESQAAAENMQAWAKWMGDLVQKGILVGAEPLQPTGKQVIGKSKMVTDGAYVEAQETVGGYLIVNAKDINDAVEISRAVRFLLKMEKLKFARFKKWKCLHDKSRRIF